MEHAKLDEFIDRLAAEPDKAERVRIMRDEMGPWLSDYIPGVAIGPPMPSLGWGRRWGNGP